MKNLHRFSLVLLASLVSFGVCANDSYYSDYPGQESDAKLLLKLKLNAMFGRSTGSGLPGQNSIGVSQNPPYNLIANGFGGEGSAGIFLTPHFVSELSVGINAYKVKQAVLDEIYLAYAAGGDPAKKLNIYSVPLTLTFQYHLAPYGGFSPYVGGGYSISYSHTGCAALNVSQMFSGPVLQGGFNLFAQDNAFITLDVKKYFLQGRMNYRASFLGIPNDLPFTLKVNPLVVGIGVGFTF